MPSSAPLLWIARDEYAQTEIWSQCRGQGFSNGLPTVLHSHGILSYDTATHAILSDPEALAGYAVVWVSALPAHLWQQAYVDTLTQFNGRVLLEGPVPPCLHELTGIQSSQTVSQEPKYRLAYTQETDQQWFQGFFFDKDTGHPERYYDMPLTDQGQVLIKPRMFRLLEEVTFQTSDVQYSRLYTKALNTYHGIFKRRLKRQHRFGKDFFNDALVLLGLLDNDLPVPPLPFSTWEDVTNLWRAELSEKDWSLQQYLLAGLVCDSHDVSQEPSLHNLPQRWKQAGLLNERTVDKLQHFAWLKCRQFGEEIFAQGQGFMAQAVENTPPDRVFQWLPLMLLTQRLHPMPWVEDEDSFASLRAVMVRGEAIVETLPELLGALPRFMDVARLCALAEALGYTETAWTLAQHGLKQWLSPTRLLFWKDTTHDNVDATGWALVFLGVVRRLLLARDTQQASSVQNDTQTSSDEMVDHVPFQQVRVTPEATVLMQAESADGTPLGPAMVRHQHVTTVCFPVFSWVASYYECPTLPGPYMGFSSLAFPIVMELILMRTLLEQTRAAGVVMPQVAPWPSHKAFCLTLRHDVDRPVPPADFDTLMQLDADLGTKSSWYWLTQTCHPEQIQQLQAAGSEVAWHAERWEDGVDTPTAITNALGSEHLVHGVTMHGGSSSDGWKGLPTVTQLQQVGMRYCDFPGSAAMFPFVPFAMTNGQVTGVSMSCTPLHYSYDVDETQVFDTELKDGLRFVQKIGGQFTLMHHPDYHVSRVADTIRWLASHPDRVDMTAAEAMHWWSATHNPSQLQCEVSTHENTLTLCVTSTQGLDHVGMVLHLPRTGTWQCVSSSPEVMHEQAEDQLKLTLNLRPNHPCELTFVCDQQAALETV